MMVSRLASVLGDRYSIDVCESISAASRYSLQVDVGLPMIASHSKDQICSCFFSRDGFCCPWKLWVISNNFEYRELSINRASVIIFNQAMPDTEIDGLSHRNISISRVIEPSLDVDPFFIRSDVMIDTIDNFSMKNSKGRMLYALVFKIRF